MGCLWWVWGMIYVVLLSSQIRMNYRDKCNRVITALVCMGYCPPRRFRVSAWYVPYLNVNYTFYALLHNHAHTHTNGCLPALYEFWLVLFSKTFTKMTDDHRLALIMTCSRQWSSWGRRFFTVEITENNCSTFVTNYQQTANVIHQIYLPPQTEQSRTERNATERSEMEWQIE